MTKYVIFYSVALVILQSCIISNPKLEKCEQVIITVASITEGSSYDIFFTDYQGNQYYINRGLEQGITLNSLKKLALNREATLHLPKFAFGDVSNHIAQLAINDSVIYTEFD